MTQLLPKVSAVVPVFNAEETLRRAVDSLLVQSEIDQIILVEDGSRDNSLSICQQLVREHSQITLLQHPQGANKGAPASRNLGLSQVKNSWIQFMDADDELLPGKIKSQLARLTGNESLVISPYTLLNENRKVIPTMQDLWAGLLRMRLGISSANLWHTESVRAAGAWNESLPNVQEYHLMFEMLKRNQVVAFSNQNLTLIHQLPNSITRSTDRLDEKRDTYFRFRQMVKEYLESSGKLNFLRWHHFTVAMGEMMRYHQPSFEVSYSISYYRFIQKIRWVKGVGKYFKKPKSFERRAVQTSF